jgi:hypothetical protein
VAHAFAINAGIAVTEDPQRADPDDITRRLRLSLPGVGGTIDALINDIGNYIARNKVRANVQNVLHDQLSKAHSETPSIPIVCVAHSQGTVIAYDVLRQAGRLYRQLRTLVTLGSPLSEYYFKRFDWGSEPLGFALTTRWLNLYDPGDIVGRALVDAVQWRGLQLVEQQVHNGPPAGRDAHDHLTNPEVARHVADEVRRVAGLS